MYRHGVAHLTTVTFFGVLLFLVTPMVASATFNLTLSPAVIDGEAKAREILRYKVTLVNGSDHMLTLYPWARDLSAGGEVNTREGADRATSLLSWLEFSRAQIDIPAGSSVELPVLVQVNLRATPGVYHAVLHLSNGPNRAEAELNNAETVSMIFNIRVPDDANERLSLGGFSADENMFTGDTASFGYRLENTGNRGIVPVGKIRIFDRRGAEVDVVEVNAESSKIEPEATALLGAVWQSGDRFGKYKAMLDVSYGKTGTIQDTVFFWVLPWKRLLSLFLTLALICVVGSLLIHSYSTSGGRKLAFVRNRFSRDREDGNEEKNDDDSSKGYFGTMVQGVEGRMREYVKRYLRAQKNSWLEKKRVDPITEVEPPAPVRTRYSILNQDGGGPVRLAHRKKHGAPNPDHIVRLK